MFSTLVRKHEVAADKTGKAVNSDGRSLMHKGNNKPGEM